MADLRRTEVYTLGGDVTAVSSITSIPSAGSLPFPSQRKAASRLEKQLLCLRPRSRFQMARHHSFRTDVSADGQRFLISVRQDQLPLTTNSTPTPITVVLNWTAALKR